MLRSRALYKLFAKAGGDKLIWKLDAHRLRILCYHGVCGDHVAGEPWVPDCFVSMSAFDKQMQYLRSTARVLPLAEAAARLREGSLPPRSVCITFDDGYANNLHLAYPVLAKYRLPATIFLSSAYMTSGTFFPFIKLKLIQLSLGSHLVQHPLLEYKSTPLDLVMERANFWWDKVEAQITGDQRETLRPLTVEELGAFNPDSVELGGHGDTHCIFKNESLARRQAEILTCLAKVSEWTGQRVRVFAYPNGQYGDFGVTDKDLLRAQGIDAAVSGIGGANGTDADLLELKRYPVGIGHDEDGFRAEVTGLRTAVLSVI